MDEGYGIGDVLGFVVQLPYPADLSKVVPPVYKDKVSPYLVKPECLSLCTDDNDIQWLLVFVVRNSKSPVACGVGFWLCPYV